MDIVERLRQRVAAETGEAPFMTAVPSYMLHREAADEIERLRAALSAKGPRITLLSETLVGGVRYEPGVYILLQVGDPPQPPEF